jgi:hypothetical protein
MDQMHLSDSTTVALIAVAWVAIAVPVYMIAQRLGSENAWFAFIPLANLWLLVDMGDKPAYWIVLLLIPYVNIIFMVIIWMTICDYLDVNQWLGLLMLAPLVNLALLYFLAFSGPKAKSPY